MSNTSYQTTIDREKRIADIVLDRLEILDPTCILAGGAPRDWWLGGHANDLDFYVYTRGNSEDYEKQLQGVGLYGDIIQPQGHNARADREGKYGAMAGLESVHEMMFRGKKIQIMRMREPTYRGVVEKFGASLSKVWYKRGNINVYPEAEITRAIGVGYFPEGYGVSNRYVDKITQRFPEYQWVFGKNNWLNCTQHLRHQRLRSRLF